MANVLKSHPVRCIKLKAHMIKHKRIELTGQTVNARKESGSMHTESCLTPFLSSMVPEKKLEERRLEHFSPQHGIG